MAAATRAARSGLTVVAAGLGLGVLVGGVLGRVAMYLLIVLNPEREGLLSDDGFEMGRFTVGGSLNLLLVAGILGAIGGLVLLAVRPLLLGPLPVQVLCVALGAGVPVGDLVVHTDGVDFRLLQPAGLAIALFVAVPALYGAALCLVVERLRPRTSPAARSVSTARRVEVLRWVARCGALAVGLLFLADLVGESVDLV